MPLPPERAIPLSSVFNGTVAAVLTTAAVYAWKLADPLRVEDALFLSSASLYSQPWRVLTSTFIHRIPPHFAFNIFTLWWFGRALEHRYGKWIFAITCLGALWTGHLFMLMAGILPIHGISGGVCGLYGFLLVADWKGDLVRTIRQQPAYWLYPLALLLLFIADRLGLTPVANLNHVVAIVYGVFVGLAATSRTARWRRWSAVAAATVITTIIGAYRFERPWQGLRSLTPLDCSVVRRPIGDVTRNAYARVLLSDSSGRPKSIFYIDVDGSKILVSTNIRRTYRLFPYLATIWRVEDNQGTCRTQFDVTRPGIVEID
jgi:membrane associated rhomboid family serine protease